MPDHASGDAMGMIVQQGNALPDSSECERGRPSASCSLARIRDVIAEETAFLTRLGVTMDRSQNFSALKTFAVQRAPYFNPTFDPDHRSPSRHDYWCRFRDSNGDTMGSVAFAIFDTPDFGEMIRNGDLWYDHPPARWKQKHFPTPIPVRAAGRVVHSGAIAIRADFGSRYLADRGVNLTNGEPVSSHMVRLARANFLLSETADFWTGLYQKTLVDNGVVARVHRLEGKMLTTISTGYMPQFKIVDDLLLGVFTLSEMTRSVLDKALARPI